MFFFFAPTLFFGNEYYGLILPLLLLTFDFPIWKERWIYFKSNPFSNSSIKYVWLIIIFCFFSMLNKLINGNSILCLKDYYAPFLLFPLLVFTSVNFFTQRTLLIILLFVSLESLVGLVEHFIGVRTFFEPFSKELLITNKEELYNSHVFGFTDNSSIFGLHLLVAFFCLNYLELKHKFYIGLFLVLFVGVIVSFNRTLIFVLTVYFLGIAMYYIFNKSRIILNDKRYFSRLVPIILMVLFLCSPIVRDSFDRGSSEQLAYNPSSKPKKDTLQNLSCTEKHSIQMLEPNELDTTQKASKALLKATQNYNTSGRKLIWLNYINEIEKRPWFGNGSDKLMLRTTQPETGKAELFHAHNSFLMLFSTYGIPLGFLFLAILIIWWKRKNYLVLISILLYSMLQYGVFWGFSMLDITFLFFILTPINRKIGY